MRTWTFPLMLAALALYACGRPAPPPAPTTTYRHVIDVMKEEAAQLTAYPGLAVRRGATLEILHGGRKIYTAFRTSCRTFEDCHSFYFIRPVSLISPVSHKVEVYAQLASPSYPKQRYIIPLENGGFIRTEGEAAGSPDGRWLAFGAEAFDSPERRPANLTFRDMREKHADIVFNMPCTPDKWLDTERLRVLCQLDVNDKPDLYRQVDDIWFEGMAQQDNASRWTVRRTRFLARRVIGF